MFINAAKKTIELSKTETAAAAKYGSDAYNDLQNARRDNPSFKVVTVIRKSNTKRDTYKGLTYDYMEAYIAKHDDEAGSTMAEFDNFLARSDEAKEALAEPCSYNEVKDWFLNRYPEIRAFHESRSKLLKKTA